MHVPGTTQRSLDLHTATPCAISVGCGVAHSNPSQCRWVSRLPMLLLVLEDLLAHAVAHTTNASTKLVGSRLLLEILLRLMLLVGICSV